MWNISNSIKNAYLKVCQEAATNNAVFSSFRSNRDYCQILEHVDQEKGWVYLKFIQDHYPKLLLDFDKFLTSETIGAPSCFLYCGVMISPTTLRYIKVLGDLIKYFGDLDDLHIIEIGGGYGGQCKIIHDLFLPRSYTIFDDPQVIGLQEKFLREFNIIDIRFNTEQKLLVEYDREKTLFLSNYAFDELDDQTKAKFAKTIECSSKGYITALNNIDEFTQNFVTVGQEGLYDLPGHTLYLKGTKE